MEVVVANEHPIISHGLEIFFVHMRRKRNGILLCAGCHGYPEVYGIKATYVHNRRFLLVEGVPAVDDFQHIPRDREPPYSSKDEPSPVVEHTYLPTSGQAIVSCLVICL